MGSDVLTFHDRGVLQFLGFCCSQCKTPMSGWGNPSASYFVLKGIGFNPRGFFLYARLRCLGLGGGMYCFSQTEIATSAV